LVLFGIDFRVDKHTKNALTREIIEYLRFMMKFGKRVEIKFSLGSLLKLISSNSIVSLCDESLIVDYRDAVSP